jgi:DNA (cytosine-5)-methyltransferase 1
MLDEFARVIVEASPRWWMLENVPNCPDLPLDDGRYRRQRINVDQC